MSKLNNKKLRKKKAEEINKKKKEAKRLEKEWKKLQEELIKMMTERDLTKEEFEDLQTTITSREVKTLDKDKLADILLVERFYLDDCFEACSSTKHSKPYVTITKK